MCDVVYVVSTVVVVVVVVAVVVTLATPPEPYNCYAFAEQRLTRLSPTLRLPEKSQRVGINKRESLVQLVS